MLPRSALIGTLWRARATASLLVAVAAHHLQLCKPRRQQPESNDDDCATQADATTDVCRRRTRRRGLRHRLRSARSRCGARGARNGPARPRRCGRTGPGRTRARRRGVTGLCQEPSLLGRRYRALTIGGPRRASYRPAPRPAPRCRALGQQEPCRACCASEMTCAGLDDARDLVAQALVAKLLVRSVLSTPGRA